MSGIICSIVGANAMAAAPPPLSAVAAPTSLYKLDTTATITTDPCVVTPSGGTGPYSGSWALLSGSGISALSPANLTSTFQATGMASGITRTTVFRITVTDAALATVIIDVPVEIERV
jgi:hypothetical protein